MPRQGVTTSLNRGENDYDQVSKRKLQRMFIFKQRAVENQGTML